MSISLEDERLVLSVKDDGVGFKEPKSGNGLKNMLLRSAALGGDCIMESSNGHGTLVKVVLPIDKITSEPGTSQFKLHAE